MTFIPGASVPMKDEVAMDEAVQKTLDADLVILAGKRQIWANGVSLDERIQLLQRTLDNFIENRDAWVTLDSDIRKVSKHHWDFITSAMSPTIMPAYLRQLIQSLKDIKKSGAPQHYASATQEEERVSVRVFPQKFTDKMIFNGVTADIHLEKGTRLEALASYQAEAYQAADYRGGVVLVMGAGNISVLGPNDILEKLIVDKKVVLFKVHPIWEPALDLLQKIFKPFIEAGYLQMVKGGNKTGEYLCQHALIDEIHLTGSDKTLEIIVFGPGEEGRLRKEKNQPLSRKKVFGELGCVTPMIVLPGDWRAEDFDYYAELIVGMMGYNHGFTCTTLRVLVLPTHWAGSEVLVKKIKKCLQALKLSDAFYPNVSSVAEKALAAYPDATLIGDKNAEEGCWILAENLKAATQEYAFNCEVWTSFASTVCLEGADASEYLKNAVEFVNHQLWGTLACALIIDPDTEKKLQMAGEWQSALDKLHYGAVVINQITALAYTLPSVPWGGYPGATYQNIQSGNVFVKNPLMLSRIEKTVVHAPFRPRLKPPVNIMKYKGPEVVLAAMNYLTRGKWIDFIRLIFKSL
jgi:hypothetical protein